MAIDHYVPQVHLRQFCSPDLHGQIYVTRKANLKGFATAPQNVCGINEGSTNIYLEAPRAIEEILRRIEPNYPGALRELKDGRVGIETIFAVAGFTTFVMTCSPGGGRIFSEPLRKVLTAQYRQLEQVGAFPKPPEAFGGKSLAELLQSGTIRIEIDPQYCKAIGVQNFFKFVGLFGNSTWDTLLNPFDDCPFFTSDYPVALEASTNPLIANRIVSLAPNLAVRIRPDPAMAGRAPDFSFSAFRGITRAISRHEAVEINKLLVQSAEDIVFYRDKRPWVADFIRRNRGYRIDVEHSQERAPNGYFLQSSLRIIRFERS